MTVIFKYNNMMRVFSGSFEMLSALVDYAKVLGTVSDGDAYFLKSQEDMERIEAAWEALKAEN